MIDRHSYEQVYLKVEPKSFLYEFLNSGDPLQSNLSVCSFYVKTCLIVFERKSYSWRQISKVRNEIVLTEVNISNKNNF